jgi:SAM-dependent methyltransferase
MRLNTESTAGDVEPARIRLARAKPRRLLISIAYRSYRLFRPLIPRRLLTRILLGASWLMNRLAWEQTLYWLGPNGGFTALRPHTTAFIHEQVGPRDRVIDIGGGPGVFTAEMATKATEVVYTDVDPNNLAAARQECDGRPNVDFVQGDGIAEAAQRGPFQLVFLLHVLEHLDDPIAALAELRSSCERLAIEVPDIEAMPHLGVRRRLNAPFYWDDDHVSEFTSGTLHSCLTEAGWSGISIRKANGCLLASARRQA